MIRGDFFSPEGGNRFLSRAHFYVFVLCVLLVIQLTVGGCKTTGNGFLSPGISQTRQFQQEEKFEGGGLISVFLNLKQPKGQEISFDLISVEVQAKDKKYSLSPGALEINSKNIGSGQLFIARNGVPADSYSTLRFTLRNVAIQNAGQKNGDTQKDFVVEMGLPSMLLTKGGDSHSLFVTWDVSASLDENGNFSPEMNASLQSIPFISDLIYVACPEIDTVYIIRTDKNWVISSLGVEGKPTYLAVDVASERLFILTPEKFSIQVVDLVTNKIIDNIFFPLTNQPSFMTVSADKRYAYILDEQGKTLLMVDLPSGAIVNRLVFTYQPHYALSLEDQNKLAISSLDTNGVYLLDPENSINSEMLSVGSSPEGLLSLGNVLFVAESGSNLITAYDLFTYQQSGSVNVGFSPRRLLVRNNQIYVTNYDSSSITLLLPGQFNVFGEIFLRGKTLELATSENQLWVYAGDEVKGGLHVIDSTSHRLSSFIDLQALPLGLAVID